MAIDLTDRYFATEFMRGGMARWRLDREAWPVRAIVLHHAAGWYGPPLAADASRRDEEQRIHSLARDHHARFGIGPGYHYVAFPSGRLYAVGKAGTQRAHTKGRNPETGTRWNIDAIGVCALGDYERSGRDEPTSGLHEAIEEAVDEIRGFRFTLASVPVFGHGATPTVKVSGEPAPQATSCPGRRLIPLLATLNRPAPPDVGAELAAIRAAAEAIERKLAAA